MSTVTFSDCNKKIDNCFFYWLFICGSLVFGVWDVIRTNFKSVLQKLEFPHTFSFKNYFKPVGCISFPLDPSFHMVVSRNLIAIIIFCGILANCKISAFKQLNNQILRFFWKTILTAL